MGADVSIDEKLASHLTWKEYTSIIRARAYQMPAMEYQMPPMDPDEYPQEQRGMALPRLYPDLPPIGDETSYRLRLEVAGDITFLARRAKSSEVQPQEQNYARTAFVLEEFGLIVADGRHSHEDLIAKVESTRIDLGLIPRIDLVRRAVVKLFLVIYIPAIVLGIARHNLRLYTAMSTAYALSLAALMTVQRRLLRYVGVWVCWCALLAAIPPSRPRESSPGLLPPPSDLYTYGVPSIHFSDPLPAFLLYTVAAALIVASDKVTMILREIMQT